MAVQIYSHLGAYYDHLWGDFSLNYLEILKQTLSQRGLSYARIVDFACGTGSLALALGKMGHVVRGVDISPVMIRHARHKSKALENVTFQVADMSKFTCKTPYDVATCTFDSLNYLPSEEAVRTFFKAVKRALKRRGLFLFDVNTEQMYSGNQEQVIQHQYNDDSFVQRLSYNQNQKIATAIFEFHDGTMEVHRQSVYPIQNIRKLLKDAGMRVLKTWSDFGGKSYRTGDERFLCLAERR